MSNKDDLEKENINKKKKSIFNFTDDEDEYEDDEEYDDEEEYEEEEDDSSIEDEITYYEDDTPYDGRKTIVKTRKEKIVNRVMAGMGIAIAAFTIFYGVVAYGIVHNKPEPQQVIMEQSSESVPETTTEEPIDTTLFVSPYTDENISESIKTKLNNVRPEPLTTGLIKVDNRVSSIMAKVVDSSKTNYENVRNIYDYLLSNFDYKSKSYVDDDSVYEFCSTVNYVSTLDMKIIYRANKALTNNSGSPDDYACAFTVMMRNLGFEAYYIDGAIYNDEGEYESHGYAIVVMEDEYYIFDPSYDAHLLKESKDKRLTERSAAEGEEASSEEEADTAIAYKAFGKRFSEVKEIFTTDDVENSIEKFAEFEKLGKFSFDASFSSTGGGSAYGHVDYSTGYSEDGNSVNASGQLAVYTDDKIYLSGSVVGSSTNTWKLVAKLYDSDMNYITESTLYSETTYSRENEVSYTPGRVGNVRLVYMVTDANGRTCAVSKMIEVKSRYSFEDETTTRERETTTAEEEITTEEITTEEEITTTAGWQEETTTYYQPEETTTRRRQEETTTEPQQPETPTEPQQDETTTAAEETTQEP